MTVKIFYHHTEDDAATVVGPNGALTVAWDGTDYAVMRRQPYNPDNARVLKTFASYTLALKDAKQRVE